MSRDENSRQSNSYVDVRFGGKVWGQPSGCEECGAEAKLRVGVRIARTNSAGSILTYAQHLGRHILRVKEEHQQKRYIAGEKSREQRDEEEGGEEERGRESSHSDSKRGHKPFQRGKRRKRWGQLAFVR